MNDHSSDETASVQPLVVYLRNPALAALLAWLIPGAGHFYQRRYAKGAIFFICIMSTFYFGFALGHGKIVYASKDRRLQFLCQLGTGLPALPAAIQGYRTMQGNDPLWGGFMAPPQTDDVWGEDELSVWHRELGTNFEVATLYTMVAGLLNIITIFDAYDGPLVPTGEPTDSQEPAENEGKTESPANRSNKKKRSRGKKKT